MNNAIEVRNLTKSYRLYRKPSDRLKSLFLNDVFSENVHALQDVSFSVKKGETIGVIGENGAGKSTLLKLISGVLSPTSGSVDIEGRVLSILELGVGFHMEFSGRDNIFFYGDILGFSRTFINSKIDGIVDFSELGEYIDKPVKTYSSGMVVRLAFSIVASFEPDVLILDEILAVGDTHFQRKSLNRILEFKKSGKTILFCSHDSYTVRMLCERAIWLKGGRFVEAGEPEKVLYNYESYQMRKEVVVAAAISSTVPVVIRDVRLVNDGTIKTFDDITFRITTEADDNTPYSAMVSIKISAAIGVCAAGTHFRQMPPMRGSRTITVTFPKASLIRGAFYAHARIYDESGIILYHEKVTPFFEVVKNCDELGLSYMPCEWKID